VTTPDDDRALTRLLTEHIPDPPERLRQPPDPGALAARLRRRRAGTVALAAAAAVLVTAAGYGAATGLRPDGTAPTIPAAPTNPTAPSTPTTPRPGQRVISASAYDTQLLYREGAAILDPAGRRITIALAHPSCLEYALSAAVTAAAVRLVLYGGATDGICSETSDLSVDLPSPLGWRVVLDPKGKAIPVLHESDRLRPGYLPPTAGSVDSQDHYLNRRSYPNEVDSTYGWELWYLGANDLGVDIQQCMGDPSGCGDSSPSGPFGSATVHGQPAELRLELSQAMSTHPAAVVTWYEHGYTFVVSVSAGGYDRDQLIRQAQQIAEGLH
jgi:hypothetical protein